MFVRRCCQSLANSPLLRTLSSSFGLIVDIDGVLIRGARTIPGTVEGFKKLSDREGNLKHPVVFLTNGSYRSELAKAEELSEKLTVNIKEDQIVLVNTPLRTFTDWHDRSVFFAGQGSSLCSTAQDLGFKRPVVLADVLRDIPMFNVISHRKRLALNSGVLPEVLPDYLPIHGIVIANTPVDWEAHVQFLLDLLLTRGELRASNKGSQLPFIACNPDLVWASEYHLPRLACGAFVHMLAELYKEMSGRELEVTWCGKPTEVTYTYALNMLHQQAAVLGQKIDKVYGIGDNVDVDVLGANNNGLSSVLVCSGLYKNENIDFARNVTVRSKRASVTEPITADYATRTIGRFIDHLLG
ncbi:hypothetical protein ACHWQZ_G013446 [Mnemiopsis leidyi]